MGEGDDRISSGEVRPSLVCSMVTASGGEVEDRLGDVGRGVDPEGPELKRHVVRGGGGLSISRAAPAATGSGEVPGLRTFSMAV